nr:MAG TPA: hypothetical protein [Caudoviricetes sp.]
MGRLCWQTAHDYNRELIISTCTYLENCKKCGNYKPPKRDHETDSR